MLFDPLAQTIAAYDRFSTQYSAQWFESEAVTDFFTRFSSRLGPTAVVLDAGCGSGREIKELSNRGIDCVGIDLSYETVKRARLNVNSGYFRVMDIRNLEYPDNIFDGLLCVAVLHHLFDRDFKKSLLQFRRVTKPDGIIALTIRLGDDYTTDEIGRTVVLRSRGVIENTLSSLGFEILDSQISSGAGDRQWLQLILLNAAKDVLLAKPLCAFCKGDMLLRENRSANAPVAASILWGDEQYLVTLDVAPLVEGHLLLVTNDHVLSTLGTGQDLARISFHKTQIDHISKRAFKRKPIFLEHGSVDQSRDPCIEHAHIHALPLKGELRVPLRRELGRLSKFKNLFRADEAVKDSEYIAYESKRGHIFIKNEDVSELPSQFMRHIVTERLGENEYRWIPCRDKPTTRSVFNSTLRKIIDILDFEISGREIVSDISQDVRHRLSRHSHLQERDFAFSKTGKGVILRLLSETSRSDVKEMMLDDLGEHQIVEKVLVPYFDSGHRGANYIGDDAAVFPWSGSRLLATSDHCPRPLFFDLGVESFEAYGWLSVIISVSDIAAMGGEPRAILLNTEMPPQMKVIDYLSFVEGVSFAANAYGARVIGGNIREAKQFSASTTVLGDIGRGGELRRDGAEPGEAIFIAGEMGLFWAGVFQRHHNLLLPLENHQELEAGLLFPEPKLAAAQLLAASGAVGACMDASDGPTQAIHSLARASGCDMIVDADIMSPAHSVELVANYLKIDPVALMLTWGNFDLVFTARENALYRSIGSDLSAYKIQKIGYVRAGPGRAFIQSSGNKIDLPNLSTDQFSGARKPSISQYEEVLRSASFHS